MPAKSARMKKQARTLSAAEIGALAHLYRGEIYRSTVWRTRLDTTTNWAVVTLGLSLSITFASPEASPIPLILVGFLIMLFLVMEARRYRYFDVWRTRARWLETHFYTPMLVDGDLHLEENWQEVLANDYLNPQYHLTQIHAIGRRIRQNYLWILMIQSLAYGGKIAVHPTPVTSLEQLFLRATLGPIPGQFIIAAGIVYVLTWCCLAYVTSHWDWQKALDDPRNSAMR